MKENKQIADLINFAIDYFFHTFDFVVLFQIYTGVK